MVPPTVSLFHAMGWPGSPLTFAQAASLIAQHNLAPFRGNVESLPEPLKGKGNPVLEARGIRFRYPGARAESLAGVDLTITQGEFIAILGQNGSGKTTLAKHFNGLLKPTSGVMLVEGKPTGAHKKRDLAKLVGYVFQNPDHQIFASTVREEISFGPKVLGEEPAAIERNVARALAATGLTGYEDKSPFLLTRGERERVAVASVLAVKPQVIVLDEPTTGLDYTHQVETMKMLKDLNDEGHTIIIITHAMWIAESFATRTVVMREGAIIADGPTRNVFADEARLSEASLTPSPLVSLSNRLGTRSLTVEGMVEELKA
jgi:energy-coupling factor transport system ATP-binding protein